MAKSEAYKVRKKTSRLKRRMKDGNLLLKIQRALFNRKVKQDRRWLRAKVESKHRGGISFEVEQALLEHTRKSEEEQRALPRLSMQSRPGDVKPEVRKYLTLLWSEREAAMTAQGQKFEAEDWWVVEKGEEYEAKKAKQRQDIRNISEQLEAASLLEATGIEEEAEGEVEEEAEEQFGGTEPPEPVPRGGEEGEENNEERWA